MPMIMPITYFIISVSLSSLIPTDFRKIWWILQVIINLYRNQIKLIKWRT